MDKTTTVVQPNLVKNICSSITGNKQTYVQVLTVWKRQSKERMLPGIRGNSKASQWYESSNNSSLVGDIKASRNSERSNGNWEGHHLRNWSIAIPSSPTEQPILILWVNKGTRTWNMRTEIAKVSINIIIPFKERWSRKENLFNRIQ